MKQDLDRLMTERSIDVAVVTGGAHNNPSMYYMVNGAHITGGILVKKQSQEPTLIHHAMERGEAAKSGLATLSMTRFDYKGLLQTSENRLEATIKLYREIFDELKVSGRVAFYGVGEQGASYALLKALDQALTDVIVRGEFENDIFDVARATKEPAEIERLRRVGQATATVMREMIDFMRDHQVVRRAHDGSEVEMLVKSDGTPLTIGDVKRFGRSRLFVYELEDAEGMIFAAGSDGGVPHSRGEADDPICLGQSIVFDFFPREMGGGYFHDMTRTFCLGYAPPEVQKVYDDVHECFDRIMAALKPDTPTRPYEELTCDIFEAQGHNTHRVNREKQEGYVHSLGHGIGLKLHERPAFGLSPSNQDVLRPGSVITIEPGLYYPERGFGVRIEDTVYLDENGQFQNLTDFEKRLVVEI
jgi:Xaa-Pro aminopeptidase